jgi:hypothetical protein
VPSGALPFDFGRTLLSGTWVPNAQVPERVTAAHQASYVPTGALSEIPGPRVSVLPAVTRDRRRLKA